MTPLSQTKSLILDIAQEDRKRRVNDALGELGLAVEDARSHGLQSFLSDLETPSPLVAMMSRNAQRISDMEGDQ